MRKNYCRAEYKIEIFLLANGASKGLQLGIHEVEIE
jgi:hypothetical protein